MKWLWMRFAFLLLGALQGALCIGQMAQHEVPWSASVIVFPLLFVFSLLLGVVFVLSCGHQQKPSWFANPFGLRRPLVWMHFGAFHMFAMCLGSLVVSPNVGSIAYPHIGVFCSAGFALWLAVRAIVAVYRLDRPGEDQRRGEIKDGGIRHIH